MGTETTGETTKADKAAAISRPPHSPRIRKIIDHLWGPTGSALLHVLIVIVMVRLVVIPAKPDKSGIEVAVIEPEESKLEEFKKELEQLRDLEIHIKPPEVEAITEPPPEMEPQTAEPQENLAALDIAPDTRSRLIMKGLYAGRSGSGRSSAMSRYGGDARTEDAVLRALRWLKTQQQPDGSWAGSLRIPDGGTGGTTGFVILTFLAHGETPSSREFGPTVQRGIEHLLTQSNLGSVGAYALVEAFGLTRITSLREAALRAMKQCVTRAAAATGNTDGVAKAFLAMALSSTKLGTISFDGLEDVTRKMMESCRTSAATSLATGGRGTWHAMFHVVGLQYLGGRDPVIDATADLLKKSWPPPTLGLSELSCCPVRANYFTTMLYFNIGGSAWEKWNKAMKAVYVKGQEIEKGKYRDSDGVEREVGYWRYDDSAGGVEHAGTQPLVSTCYVVQQLMVYYRLPPTHKPPETEAKPTEKSADDVVVEVL